jgi:hypothetical protein
MPQALADRPVLSSFLEEFHRAFNDLNARRQYNMAELPLQIIEIMAYAKMFHFDIDMDFFYRAMTGMDEEYMLYMIDQRKTEAEQRARQKK